MPTPSLHLPRRQEIYPGSKLTHFRAIHKASGIPYQDMVFYDNERWNITECAKLGITCVYAPRGEQPGGAWEVRGQPLEARWGRM